MLLLLVPLLLLLLQAGFTFRRLRQHSRGHLWTVFLLAVPLQLLAGVAATVVSTVGFGQRGTECATGAGVFFAGGILLAVTVVPGLALVAAVVRWRHPVAVQHSC